MRLRSPLLALAALAVAALAPHAAAQTDPTPFAIDVNGPTGIVQLEDGRVLVSDLVGGGRVVALTEAPDGTVTQSVYATGLVFPTDLIQLEDGRVLVSEGQPNRVSVISDSDGNPIDREDYSTEVTSPFDLAQLPDGRVLVVERGPSRVVVLEENDDGMVTRSDFVTGLDAPGSLVVLEDGRVMITEGFEDGRVSVISDTGGLPAERTDYVTGLDSPVDIYQLADGSVLVSDRGENGFGRVVVIVAVGPDSRIPLPYADGVDSGYFDMVQLTDGRVLANLVDRVAVINVSPVPYVSELTTPVDLAVLDGDRLLVAEEAAGRVSVIADGGTRSDLVAGLDRPSGLAVSGNGRILVTNAVVRIEEVAPDGTLSRIPVGFRILSKIAVLGDGRILGTEFGFQVGRGQVVAVEQGDDGAFTRTVFATGFDNPTSLAVLDDGRVLVVEAARGGFEAGRVWALVEDEDGTVTRSVIASGLTAPSGLAVLDDGRVLVGSTLFVEIEGVGTGVTGGVTAIAPDGTLSVYAKGLLPMVGGLAVLEDGRVVASAFDPETGTGNVSVIGSVVVSPEGGDVATEQGDAPALPTEPQDAVGASTITGELGASSGRLAGSLSESVDCYAIEVADVDAFTASTLNAVTAADTELVLFTDGNVTVVANDDADGTVQSQIPAGALAGRGLGAGRYSLCVTLAGAGPVNAAGEPIIPVQNNDFEAVRYPSASSGDFTVASFSAPFDVATGAYTIELTGVGAGGSVSSEAGPAAEGPLALAVWPNPTARTARVGFALEAAADVEVAVYDALGRRVAVVAEGPHAAGAHEVPVPADALAAGVYVVRVQAGDAVAARMLTVIR